MPPHAETVRPPTKQHKKDKKEDKEKDKAKDSDVPMAAGGSASGSKRAARSDSDEFLGVPVTPRNVPEPVTEDMLTHLFDKFTTQVEGKLTSMQGMNDSHFEAMSNGFARSLSTLAERVETNEAASKLKFDSIEAQLTELNDRMKAPPPAPAAAASSSGGRAAAFPTSTPRTTPSGPSEDCLVFIRGFPSDQPGFILKEYAIEALAILPEAERSAIRLRISPADTQFSMVFPSPEQAAHFVTMYRALSFVFLAPDKSPTPLTCRTGKPLALRRRGGLIRPVYAALEEVLRSMPSMSDATISQTSRMKFGAMTTAFFALRGRGLTPLFSIVFQDTPEEMFINEFNVSEGCPLSDEGVLKIRSAALA
jgi:hypothetical protein